MRELTGIMSRMERVEIRRRTQRGRHARVNGSKTKPPAILTGAWPLYGYLWGDPAKGARTYYIIDPETAPIVRRIFQAIANGVPIRQIARELEQEGIPTPFQILEERGQLPKNRTASSYWRRGQLLRMIRHPAYWGKHSAYRTETTKEKIRPADTGITKKVLRKRERDVDDPDRVKLYHTAPALVSIELAQAAQAQLKVNKENSAGRNPDPLATIFRGMAVCGHCGGSLSTGATRKSKDGDDDRRYFCRARQAVAGGIAPPCDGGRFSVKSSVLDAAAWADIRAWLEKPENVSNLLAEWEQEAKTSESSIASRLEASAAIIATLHDKMGRLAETIADTSEKESRRVLQEKLDAYATQARKEEGKRERLMREASEVADYARDERDIREWVRVMAERATSFGRAEQRAALMALGAQVTVWRTDYTHPDGWPQRYRVTLNFASFSGEPVTLPANREPDNTYGGVTAIAAAGRFR